MKKGSYLYVIVAAMAISGFIFLEDGNQGAGDLDAFAKCLADRGITMYGADWCPHCQNQKKAFGSSFGFVPYVECPDDPKRCLTAGISGFPTWIFPNGKKLEGEQELQKLSEESGCSLPAFND
ncbi:MAG: hypothetical protein A2939_03520 [Parcubacteria group bacterium RIFCSPLOWO2_01_FULL_48_18]|nr:MAG: hypothetical protein A2939_03520 [Parcubacteria group bacterium RIFCSPLOWO2_01_FULL_48_18]OHB23119.1 MAG: hypothetical protein A3J67_03140 [Parcubacteria group bacterium RIFCSPHIGHO2_02_FULL_48_10b]